MRRALRADGEVESGARSEYLLSKCTSAGSASDERGPLRAEVRDGPEPFGKTEPRSRQMMPASSLTRCSGAGPLRLMCL